MKTRVLKNSLSGKDDLFFILAVVLLSFGFGIFLLRYRFAVSNDEVNYLKLGASAASYGFSQIWHTYWSPLYPLLIGLFSRIFHNPEMVARLISVGLTSLTAVPVFLFARSFFDPATARWAAGLFAFHPVFVFMGTGVQTEPLYTFLVTAAVFTGWLALSGTGVLAGLAQGTLSGLAYLTRPEGVGCILVFLGTAAVSFLFSKKKKRIALTALISLVGFLAAASPYLLYLHRATSRWMISGKSANQQAEAFVFANRGVWEKDLFRSLNESNTEVAVDQIYHQGTFHRDRPGSIVRISLPLLFRKYANNLYDVLRDGFPRAFTSVLFILFILGLFGKPWDSARLPRELYLCAYLVFFWFILIPLFHVIDRYFMPLMPLCFLWIGKGVLYLKSWIMETFGNHPVFSRYRAGRVALWILIGGILLTFVPELARIMARSPLSREYWADPVEQKDAGLWLRDHAEGVPVIMSRNHAVDFYAGNYRIDQSVTIPTDSLDRILAYADYRNVQYLVLGERNLKDYPHLEHLLDGENVPGRLERIYESDRPAGLKTVIYRLHGKQ